MNQRTHLPFLTFYQTHRTRANDVKQAYYPALKKTNQVTAYVYGHSYWLCKTTILQLLKTRTRETRKRSAKAPQSGENQDLAGSIKRKTEKFGKQKGNQANDRHGTLRHPAHQRRENGPSKTVGTALQCRNTQGLPSPDRASAHH